MERIRSYAAVLAAAAAAGAVVFAFMLAAAKPAPAAEANAGGAPLPLGVFAAMCAAGGSTPGPAMCHAYVAGAVRGFQIGTRTEKMVTTGVLGDPRADCPDSVTARQVVRAIVAYSKDNPRAADSAVMVHILNFAKCGPQ